MGERRSRVRDLGVSIGMFPTGTYNAITDVNGVEVGHTTIKWGGAELTPGHGPARTGVTTIWPDRRDLVHNPVAAGFFALSGTGELTARSMVEELGYHNTPIVLTGSTAVGLCYDAVWRYLVRHDPHVGVSSGVLVPLVAECDDSYLHDARGFHVRREHVNTALDSASSGPVREGCVGAGMGTHCFQFKGGIGTSSRQLPVDLGSWTVGVLLLTNFGRRSHLIFAGMPLGEHFPLDEDQGAIAPESDGSCIVVIATDAPLDGRQLARVAKRAALGLGRTGSFGGNGSGELLIAFSTTCRPHRAGGRYTQETVEGDAIDPLFAATVEATEESVLNALCMAETVDGRFGRTREAIPLDRLRELLDSRNSPAS